jgi:LPS export ABC transporter protein LptC
MDLRLLSGIDMKILTPGLIISLLVSVLYFTWFSDDPQQNIQDAGFKKEKPIILKNPELFDYKLNKMTMQVKAKTARVYENKNVMLLSKIDGHVYSEDAAEKSTRFFAKSGRIKGKSKFLTVWGNVRVLFSDGQQLFTEKLNLDQKKGILYNRVPVRVVSDNEKIVASHMMYNLNTGILTLSKPKAAIDMEL